MNNHPNLHMLSPFTAGLNHFRNSPSTIACACSDHQINIRVLNSDCKSISNSIYKQKLIIPKKKKSYWGEIAKPTNKTDQVFT